MMALDLTCRETAQQKFQFGRTPPHNIEAEQALLGAILINNEAAEQVTWFLRPADFFEPLHGRIFDACIKRIAAGRRVTPVTLNGAFNDEPPVGSLTVAQYLGRLVAGATTVINAGDYGRTIREMAMRRELAAIGEEMIAAAHDADDASPAEQVQRAEKALYDLGQTGARQSHVTLSTAADSAIDAAARAYERGAGICGLSTGIRSIDGLIGGLEAGNLIIVGGRPGMGKSAIAVNVARNVAASGTPVAVFSLEMSAEELARRVLAAESGVSATDIRRGTLTEDGFKQIRLTRQEIGKWPLHFDVCAGLTPQQLLSKARRFVREHGVGLVVVDYLQLMRVPGVNGEYDRVSEASGCLKPLAVDLKIPVIALSQLSRSCEQREDKRPLLSDLRGSGSLEQDADYVALMYREEYYLRQSEPEGNGTAYENWLSRLNSCRNKAEFILAKGRHGPTGTAVLEFDGTISLFSDGGSK